MITTFNSNHGAKNLLYDITSEFLLCDKLNGLSDAKTNCSKYNDGKCNGACIEKETVLVYNIRAQKAIEKHSISNKNCVIVEKGREVGEYAAFLIKNGQFNGMGFYDLNHQINNIHILESIITPMKSDRNNKHIIENYLRKKKVFKIIELNNSH